MTSFWKRIASPFLRKGMTSEQIWLEIYGGRESTSGLTVNTKTALQVATVLACVRVLANGLSQVPFRLYQDSDDGTKRIAREHPVHRLIYRQPNEWQTSFEFRQTIAMHRALAGNAYVWKGRVGSNRELRVLEPIEPHRVTVNRDKSSGVLTYRVTADDGAARVFPAEDIWHIRGPSWNSWQGLEIVKLARDAIGLAMVTEQSQAELHRNGSKITGSYAVDEKLSPERFEFLSKWLDAHASGGKRAGKPLILDQGAKWLSHQMSSVDSQHLETRKHQVEEVCRILGVQPIMVYQSDKASTYASAEQMFIAHVVHTLGPWYESIEQSADINLLTPDEIGDGYYTKFTPNALMRGASKDRADFYTKALGSGGHGTAWMTRNEVRKLEELDPIEGGDDLNIATKPAKQTLGDEADAQV